MFLQNKNGESSKTETDSKDDEDQLYFGSSDDDDDDNNEGCTPSCRDYVITLKKHNKFLKQTLMMYQNKLYKETSVDPKFVKILKKLPLNPKQIRILSKLTDDGEFVNTAITYIFEKEDQVEFYGKDIKDSELLARIQGKFITKYTNTYIHLIFI